MNAEKEEVVSKSKFLKNVAWINCINCNGRMYPAVKLVNGYFILDKGFEGMYFCSKCHYCVNVNVEKGCGMLG